MPDWLEERIRREVAGWDTPPPRLRAARYKNLEQRSARGGRLLLALGVAVAAVGLGSAQVGAVPARVVQLVTVVAEPVVPALTPAPAATQDADDAQEATAPVAPPAPNRPITIVGGLASPSPGHRPQPSPSASPRGDDRDHFDDPGTGGGDR